MATVEVVRNGPKAEVAGLADKADVLCEDKQEESRPLSEWWPITRMGGFSLKPGKAKTSINRQAEVTSKQPRMSLKLQEGWMLETESGE